MAAELGPKPAGTLPELLGVRAVGHPDLPAVVHDDEELTYADLHRRSGALAAALAGEVLGKSARLGILVPNGIDWVVLACAASRTGAVLVPLSTLLRPPELAAQLRAASVTHLVVARSHRGRSYLDDLESISPGLLGRLGDGVRDAELPNLRRVWVDDDLPVWSRQRDGVRTTREVAEAMEARVCPADDFAVMFTSGSRGAPKGAIHTHGGAIRAVAAGLDARCLGPGDRLYIPMPFFWMGGFGGGLLSVLVAGATLLTESDPTPERTVAFLERRRATLFRGWPDQAAQIAAAPTFAEADLSSLKSGSLDAVLPERLRAVPGARANLFGMTETFGPYSGYRLDREMPRSAWGSCGRPFEGVEVRILDEDGRVRPPGERGEIAVRGPNMMRGIVGRLRSETFTREGFYRTGDLGHLDADGFLFYAGRVDDMFKVSGATVYPSEVEAALRASPLVAAAYVTDVLGPAGPEVGAAVVPAGAVTVEEIAADSRARLSAFKVPKRWVILGSRDDVPTMATGKVDKAALQALIADA